MKTLISFLSATLLIGAFLYPLLYVGIGRPVSWLLTATMAGGGVGGIYLLVKYRHKL